MRLKQTLKEFQFRFRCVRPLVARYFNTSKKKVLLSDFKRCTTHCAASNHSSVLPLREEVVPQSHPSGVPSPILGYPSPRWDIPQSQRGDIPALRYPLSLAGTGVPLDGNGISPGKELGPGLLERSLD